MSVDSKKSPYSGLWAVLIFMILPSFALTALVYAASMKFQFGFGKELNWAAAKTVGFGIGSILHLGCWIMGAFSQDLEIVKNRVKEFFSDAKVSLKLAFTWYWDDIKVCGIAFWIELAIIVSNAAVFVNALLDFLELYKFIR